MSRLRGVILVQPRPQPLGRLRGPPVQLLRIANRSLVEHALDALRAAGAGAVAIAAGADDLPALRAVVPDGGPWNLALEHVALEAEGELAALQQLAAWAGDATVVVTRGDAYLPAGVGVAALRATGTDVLHVAREPVRRRFRRQEEQRPESDLGLGTEVLGPRAMAALRGLPDPGPRTLRAAVETLPQLHVAQVRLENGWRLSSTSQSLLEGNRMALEDIEPGWEAATIADSEIDGKVLVAAGAEIRDSRVRGPAVIGPDTVLDHAFVGPYTSIGARCRVVGSEVGYSVMLDEVELRHVGWRIDASILGHATRVVRDFALPSSVQLNLGAGASIAVG